MSKIGSSSSNNNGSTAHILNDSVEDSHSSDKDDEEWVDWDYEIDDYFNISSSSLSNIPNLMIGRSFSMLSILSISDLHQVAAHLYSTLNKKIDLAVDQTKTLSRRASDWINQREKDRQKNQKLFEQRRRVNNSSSPSPDPSDVLLMTYISYLTKLFPPSNENNNIENVIGEKLDNNILVNNQSIPIISDHFSTYNRGERLILDKLKISLDEESKSRNQKIESIENERSGDANESLKSNSLALYESEPIKHVCTSTKIVNIAIEPSKLILHSINVKDEPSQLEFHSPPTSSSLLPSLSSRTNIGYLNHGSVFIAAAEANIVSSNAPSFHTITKPIAIYRNQSSIKKNDLPPLPTLLSTWNGISDPTSKRNPLRSPISSALTINPQKTEIEAILPLSHSSCLINNGESIRTITGINSDSITDTSRISQIPDAPAINVISSCPDDIDIPPAPPLNVNGLSFDTNTADASPPTAPPLNVNGISFDTDTADPLPPTAPPLAPDFNSNSSATKTIPVPLSLLSQHSSISSTLKHIHWSKLNYNSIRGSIWEDINKSQTEFSSFNPISLDLTEVAEKFKLENRKEKLTFGNKKPISIINYNRTVQPLSPSNNGAIPSHSNNKTVEFTAIDSIRLYNVEIACAKLKVNAEVLKDMLILENWKLDEEEVRKSFEGLNIRIQRIVSSSLPSLGSSSSVPLSLEFLFPLSLDQLEILAHIVPTSEEQGRILKLPPLSSYNNDRVGNVEIFMRTMSQISQVKLRIELFAFISSLFKDIIFITQTLHTLLIAKQQVMSSIPFRSILALILTVGNTLNKGSSMGEAYGFRLSWLKELESIKRTDGGGNMWSWIVTVSEREYKKRKCGEELNADEVLSNDFLLSLSTLPQASIIDISALSENFASIQTRTTQMKNELIRKSPDPYCLLLSTFLHHFGPIFQYLNDYYNTVIRELNVLTIWLGESESSTSSIKTNIFALIEDMRLMYEKVKVQLDQTKKQGQKTTP